MPCQCDYIKPTEREAEAHKVCYLLRYAMRELSLDIPSDIVSDSAKVYGNTDKLDARTAQLCKLLTEMSDRDRMRIVWNGRHRLARELATWWDFHREADRRRAVAERKERKRQKIRAEALAKLSDIEREALGL